MILLIVLLVIVAAAAVSVYRAKKRGVKCIGCPAGGKCGSCGRNCAVQEETE